MRLINANSAIISIKFVADKLSDNGDWIVGYKEGLLGAVGAIEQCVTIDPESLCPKWISVEDRLPENDQWALCFMKDKSFGTFRVFQWNYIDWQWNDGNEWFDEKDVIHWMPLPKPPGADMRGDA